MPQPQVAPFGSWKSPVTAQDIYGKYAGIGPVRLDGPDLYWLRSLPEGRSVVVRRKPDGEVTMITPPDFDVRTRVHEYGGGEYIVAGGVVYFSNFADQKLYRQAPGEEPQSLTPAGMRYADAVLDAPRGRLILVREDHTTGAPQAANTIAALSLEGGGAGSVLVSGRDFYSNPRLSSDGGSLAWLTWNHPSMPWDNAELWVGRVLPDGGIGGAVRVAGGGTESIFQPEWSPDGVLYFVSDRSGWWNLYRWNPAGALGAVEPLCPMEAEFGEPQWQFDTCTYAFESAGRLVCVYSRDCFYHLAELDTRSLELKPIDTPYDSIYYVCARAGQVFFTGGSPTRTTSLVQVDLEAPENTPAQAGAQTVLQTVRQVTIDPAYFSAARPIEFPTENGLTAPGFFYPPQNPDFKAPAGELPPLLVMCHGGPTGASSSGLRYGIQYWTTRGIGVLDVNYGGSTGYGRAYRERLKGQWGLVDVADCVNGARYLAQQGLADPQRLAITGGSAGGFVVLCALAFYKVFNAGASYFGVSDLEALAQDTHKFESHYLDTLVAPYPEQRQVYLDRSPIYHLEGLSAPMILLQGLDDPVVTPRQAQMMYEAVRGRGLPVAYLTFPGEQHGFVKYENNVCALEAELYFYSRVLHFPLVDAIVPVEIENLVVR